jgi:Flp pilus assembly protein TadG
MNDRQRGSRGQALVEFAIVLIPFLFLVMGIIDVGRGVYTYNAVAEAAREVARVTSVHPYDSCAGGCVIGSTAQVQAVIDTQIRLVPGLTRARIAITCTDITDGAKAPADCRPGDFVKVTMTVPFQVLTPLLNMVAPTTLTATSHIQFP